MYVSYDFYKQTFGDTIPEADFSKSRPRRRRSSAT